MQKISEIYDKLPKFVKNRYLIVTILLIFWVAFFDSHNWIRQAGLKSELKQLEEDKKFYLNEIKKDSIALFNLSNNPETQEKFAREKYMMVKENEDLILILKSDE